eukprot:CFRG5113T1
MIVCGYTLLTRLHSGVHGSTTLGLSVSFWTNGELENVYVSNQGDAHPNILGLNQKSKDLLAGAVVPANHHNNINVPDSDTQLHYLKKAVHTKNDMVEYAISLQELLKKHQEGYVNYMKSHLYQRRPTPRTKAQKRNVYMESVIRFHKNSCPKHLPGLVRVAGLPNRGYCFGSARIEGERVCDVVSTPDYGTVSEEAVKDHLRYDVRTLYGKKFAYIPFYKSSTFTSVNRQSMGSTGITLTSQGSWNRLFHLKHLTQVWQGPVSFALLLDSEDQLNEVDTVVKNDPLLREFADIHVVWRLDHSSEDVNSFYPINMLRNMALQTVETTYVFVLDADVTPNAPMSTYSVYMADGEATINLQKDKSQIECSGLDAFVPPAVEMAAKELKKLYDGNGDIGRIRKEQVVEMFFTGNVLPMHVYFGPAYAPTNHYEWSRSKTVDEIPYLTRFEPYYIARMPIPLFNETFVNRGGNFAQQVYEMSAGGYRFHRLPEAFVVDIPHTKAEKDEKETLKNNQAAAKNHEAAEDNITNQVIHDENMTEKLWSDFYRYVRHRYRHNMPTPIVSDSPFRLYRRAQEKVLNALWQISGKDVDDQELERMMR